MNELYKRIKSRREELGLSQEELAKKLGYKSRSSINKIEKGENDIPQSKVKAFADALATTPAYLMGWDDSYISEKIKTRRQNHNLSIEDLAKYLKLNIQDVENFEKGKFEKLTVDKLENLAKILDIEPNVLLNLTEEEYKDGTELIKQTNKNRPITSNYLNFLSNNNLQKALLKNLDLKFNIEEISKNILEDITFQLVDEKDAKHNKDEQLLINNFRKLNEIGQNEALKRVEELTQLDKYLQQLIIPTKVSSDGLIVADNFEIILDNNDFEDRDKNNKFVG